MLYNNCPPPPPPRFWSPIKIRKKRKYRHGKRDGEKAKKKFPLYKQQSSREFIEKQSFLRRKEGKITRSPLLLPSIVQFNIIWINQFFFLLLLLPFRSPVISSIGGFGSLEVLPAHTNRLLPVIGLALPPFSLACQYKSSLTEETGAQLGGGGRRRKAVKLYTRGRRRRS